MLDTFPQPSRAVVVGASGGLGGAFVTQILQTGFGAVHALSRTANTASDGRITGTIDLLDEASIAGAVAALAAGDPFRLAIAATGLLHGADMQPEKTMRALESVALARAFAVNTIGPALLAKHLIPLLPRSGKSVFAVLSARVGSIEDNRLGGWYGYRASKAALNQMIRTLAIEAKRARPDAIIVALHPGTVETGLSAPFRGKVSAEKLFTPDESARHLLTVIDGLKPDDSGGFFAWDGQKIPF